MGIALRRGRRAVFFDRDGVLTELVPDPATGELESPHSVADLRLRRGTTAALRALRRAGFELFVVSNQPSFAKGKIDLETLRRIAGAFERRLAASGVTLRAAYYCFHHPDGVVPGYGRACRCRKPSPHFVKTAARGYGIDLSRSWFVGDRETDVECGRRAGCRTVLVGRRVARSRPSPAPDRMAQNVAAAVRSILRQARAADGNT